MNINLIFCCRVTNKKEDISASPRSKENIFQLIELEQLKKTIISLNKIKFRLAFINIEFLDLNSDLINEIELLIHNNIKAKIIYFHKERPTDINQWLTYCENLKQKIFSEELILNLMNHDHEFKDYSDFFLIENCKKIFKNTKITNKVFYYSHLPEVISWSYNNKPGISFKKNFKEKIAIGSKINNWLDSFCIMEFSTFHRIFKQVKKSPTYYPRMDWPDVEFNNLDLTPFVAFREFFYHQDGYNHISNINIASKKNEEIIKLIKNDKINYEKITTYYYDYWLKMFYLCLRDALIFNHKFGLPTLKKMEKTISKTFNDFIIFFLKDDLDHLNINPNNHKLIFYDIKKLINKNKYDIHKMLIEDISSIKFSFYIFTLKLIPQIIWNFYRLFKF